MFEFVLTSTYFTYKGKYYEQVEGVAMRSPLAPVIADIFMEGLECKTLEQAHLKSLFYHRYVDDTFIVWQHGQTAVDDFICALNSMYDSIKFTVEHEVDGKLPSFLYILVECWSDETLSCTVYRKKTHTDLYLYRHSHHPGQKRGIMLTLLEQAHRIAGADILLKNMCICKKYS